MEENQKTQIYIEGEPIQRDPSSVKLSSDEQSRTLIKLNEFWADKRFSHIKGKGYSVVILDTGINPNHKFFQDSRGKSRIVYQYDFAEKRSTAIDKNGHGTNVASICASSDKIYTGCAPEANIIALKVFYDSGSGTFSEVEQALKWVLYNKDTYNIAAVNMSISQQGNYQESSLVMPYGVNDEIQKLNEAGIIVVCAAANYFYRHNSQPGVGYPASDPYALAISAVFDTNVGKPKYSSGAQAFSTDKDRITPFSQRHEYLTSIMAPGAAITGAGKKGTDSLSTYHGTSQASPHIAGVAVLAQMLADELGVGRLRADEFIHLMRESGDVVNDGDDEDDNVINTGLNFRRINVLKLGESMLNWAKESSCTYEISCSFDSLVKEKTIVEENPNPYSVHMATPAHFYINRRGATFLPSSVKLELQGSLKKGEDYYLDVDSKIDFLPHETKKIIPLRIIKDTVPESTKQLTAELSLIGPGNLDNSKIVITVKDDDAIEEDNENSLKITIDKKAAFCSLTSEKSPDLLNKYDIFNNNSLVLYSSSKVSLPLNYSVSKNSSMTFVYLAKKLADFQGIEFQLNDGKSYIFNLSGTDTSKFDNTIQYNSPLGKWQKIKIPLGDFFEDKTIESISLSNIVYGTPKGSRQDQIRFRGVRITSKA